MSKITKQIFAKALHKNINYVINNKDKKCK